MARRNGNSILVILGLGLVGLLASGGDANAATPTREPNLPVFLPEDEAKTKEFAATVCVCANELANAGGNQAVTPEALRFCVADRWWPTTHWPPIAEDPQSVLEAWALAGAFAVAFTDDPDGFRAEFCVSVGPLIPAEVAKIGDVMHTGAIDISTICAPPIPQEVPIRVLFGGADGFTAQAWDFEEVEWQDLHDELGELRRFATVAQAVNGTRLIVTAFATTFCAPDEPTPPTPPLPVGPVPDPTPPVTPVPPMTPLLPVPFQKVPIPPIDQYPWELPLIHRGENGQHWPTPGMFFLVRDDDAPTDPILALDTILGIARVALASAYAMAGDAHQLANIPDQQVLDYVALIACSPWNDKAYGATSSAVVGGNLAMGPHSRGINMLPRHADNIGELVQGKPPIRATTLTGGIDSSVPGNQNGWAQLWLPPIRLDMLRDFGVVSTAELNWSNGDSVIVPPPVVWNHNVKTTVSPPGGSWGC